MCREMEQIYSEGIMSGEKLGIEKGALKKAREVAVSMAEDGMKPEKIAHFLKVSVDVVREWIK